jgi:cell wall-associated NlpC family hydrolase
MRSLSYVPPPHRYGLLLALGAVLLSGCAGLNPLKGVEPGPDAAWSGSTARPTARPAPRPAARPAHAAPTTGRPAPAASPAARPARRVREAAEAEAVPVVRVADRAEIEAEEAPAPGVLAGSAAVAQHLRAEGAPWIGTPYRYGGQSRAGMDCSGFARTLMREALGVELTRMTSLQVQEGVAVEKEDLLPGDLVFFRRRGTRHVGVYLGDGEFIHASSSNGVIVSRLDEGYYERHYWTARRVLPDPERVALPGAPEGESEAPPPAEPAAAPATEPAAVRPPVPVRRAPAGSSRAAW